MSELRRLLPLAGTLALLAGTLGGCAQMGPEQAADTEKLLAAAGFQMRPADSTGEQQNLASMPARELVAHARGAKAVYSYADGQNCRCVYVGGPKEYAEFRQLETSEAIARHMNEVSTYPLSWDSGQPGPWGDGTPADVEPPEHSDLKGETPWHQK